MQPALPQASAVPSSLPVCPGDPWQCRGITPSLFQARLYLQSAFPLCAAWPWPPIQSRERATALFRKSQSYDLHHTAREPSAMHSRQDHDDPCNRRHQFQTDALPDWRSPPGSCSWTEVSQYSEIHGSTAFPYGNWAPPALPPRLSVQPSPPCVRHPDSLTPRNSSPFPCIHYALHAEGLSHHRQIRGAEPPR